MARVTVEDCVERIPNPFELVMLAAQRARDISAGAPLSLDRDNDKNPVVALREIADAAVDFNILKNSLVRGLQKTVEPSEPEEEIVDFMASEQILLGEGNVREDPSGEEDDLEEELDALDIDKDIPDDICRSSAG